MLKVKYLYKCSFIPRFTADSGSSSKYHPAINVGSTPKLSGSTLLTFATKSNGIYTFSEYRIQ